MPKRSWRLLIHVKYPDVSVVPVNCDWCVVCQKKTLEPLQTPTLSGYAMLANNLTEFASRGALPSSLNLSQLDDGSGLLPILTKMSAKYLGMYRISGFG